MPSGDVVLNVNGAMILEATEQSAQTASNQSWPWIVKLQKAPTSTYNRVDVEVVVGHNNPESSPFDITKTYNITITEV